MQPQSSCSCHAVLINAQRVDPEYQKGNLENASRRESERCSLAIIHVAPILMHHNVILGTVTKVGDGVVMRRRSAFTIKKSKLRSGDQSWCDIYLFITSPSSHPPGQAAPSSLSFPFSLAYYYDVHDFSTTISTQNDPDGIDRRQRLHQVPASST